MTKRKLRRKKPTEVQKDAFAVLVADRYGYWVTRSIEPSSDAGFRLGKKLATATKMPTMVVQLNGPVYHFKRGSLWCETPRTYKGED